MSGRMGDLKTAGRGCVDPLGVPSAPAMVTVGRVVMFALCMSRVNLLFTAGARFVSSRGLCDGVGH